MKTDDLKMFALQDNDRMAEVWRSAIIHAYPDLKNLEVSYNGKTLTIDFDGDVITKTSVLCLVNDLINKVTETPKKEFDIDSILNNSNEVMKSLYGDNWRDKIKGHPYITLRDIEPKTNEKSFFKWYTNDK